VAEQIDAMIWLGLTDDLDSVKGSGIGYYTGEPNGLFLSISHKTNDNYKWQIRTVDNGSVLQVRTKAGNWSARRNVSLT
jgi:hypothetical protein